MLDSPPKCSLICRKLGLSDRWSHLGGSCGAKAPLWPPSYLLLPSRYPPKPPLGVSLLAFLPRCSTFWALIFDINTKFVPKWLLFSYFLVVVIICFTYFIIRSLFFVDVIIFLLGDLGPIEAIFIL